MSVKPKLRNRSSEQETGQARAMVPAPVEETARRRTRALGPFKQFNVHVPYSLATKLRVYAAMRDLTVSKVVIEALEDEVVRAREPKGEKLPPVAPEAPVGSSLMSLQRYDAVDISPDVAVKMSNFRIPLSLHEEMKECAEANGESMKDFTLRAIDRYLSEH